MAEARGGVATLCGCACVCAWKRRQAPLSAAALPRGGMRCEWPQGRAVLRRGRDMSWWPGCLKALRLWFSLEESRSSLCKHTHRLPAGSTCVAARGWEGNFLGNLCCLWRCPLRPRRPICCCSGGVGGDFYRLFQQECCSGSVSLSA